MQPIIVKPYTDKYQVDKEMFFLSLCNIYRHKDIPIELGLLGIPEEAYISLLDLPIIDIKGRTREDFDRLLFSSVKSDDITLVVATINSSIHGFFLLKTGEEFYFNQFKRNMYPSKCISLHIHNFVKYHREKKLLDLFGDDIE